MSPLHSWGSPTRGIKLEVATSPLPSRRPTRGRIATQPLHSQGVPNKGGGISSGYLSPAFSVAHKRRNCCATPPFAGFHIKADQIRKGYLTLVFSGAHKRA